MTVGKLLEGLQGIDPKTEISIYSSEDIPMYDCEKVTDYEILDTFKTSDEFCIQVREKTSRIVE